ncbi:MAG TPA: thioredoxin family protein [Bryobacteraceae bacterium]|nr:thioredoxin family protein [Bryobacteraceae bacterium]
MKKFLSFEVSIWRAMGVAVLLGAVAIASGSDTNMLTKFRAFHSRHPLLMVASAAEPAVRLADEGPSPGFGGAVGWLNSAPLDRKALRGKVVLVNVWTYSCINSLRELPYMKAWAAKYKEAGLVVIGVHTPEFSFEKDVANIEKAVKDSKVTYPVAIDSDYGIWRAFNNEYWPANYFIDAKGRIRFHYFGEGAYADSERVIRELLKENGATGLDESMVSISADGVEAPPGEDVRSPETYAGYRRTERFASPERLVEESRKSYTLPAAPSLNQWGLGGLWAVEAERAVLQTGPGKIMLRFHSRDLHMVLGPQKHGTPIRFKVRLDGAAPGENCGSDSTPDGSGEVREPRLYQLIRQKGRIQDRTFEIEFLDPGVQAFSFTFG